MKDRIALLMQQHQINSSKLAEMLDVQPSAISHILSGRNKPGYELISRLLVAFPGIDARWLLTGQENYGQDPSVIMPVTALQVDRNQSETIKPVSGLFDTTIDMRTIANSSQLIQDAATGNLFTDAISSSIDAGSHAGTSRHREADLETNLGAPNIKQRKVSKVILLYDDGSFEEFENTINE